MFRLFIRHRLPELLSDFLANQNAGFHQSRRLVVQNRHVAEWLTYQTAQRQRVTFNRPALFGDAAVRTCAEELAAAKAFGDRPAPHFLFTDSLSLLILGALRDQANQRNPANGDSAWAGLDRYLTLVGANPTALWSLARETAGLFAGYGQMASRELQDLTQGRVEVSDQAWQGALWQSLFADTAVRPLGQGLIELRSTMETNPGPDRLGFEIFGSAFLPDSSLDFLLTAEQQGWIDLDYYLFLPFQPAAAPNPARSWAGLGQNLTSKLHAIHPALVDDRLLGEVEPVWAAPLTITLVAADGPRPQVEFVKEAILRLLDLNPGLAVNDIAIFCPQIEIFRPIIASLFPGRLPDGREDWEAPDHLPFHFLDDSPADSAYLQAVRMILDLYQQTLTRSVLAGLLRNPAFAGGFGLEARDADAILDWVGALGLQGFSGTDASLAEASWDRGLERLLLGLALPEDYDGRPLHLPPSQTRNLATWIRALTWLQAVADGRLPGEGEATLATWATSLRRLFSPHATGHYDEAQGGDEDVGPQTGRLRATDPDGPRLLSEAISATVQRSRDLEVAGLDVAAIQIPFPLYRAILWEYFDETRPSGGTALLHGVCVAGFQPFRSIPFEHLFFLGLDEGVFPAAEAQSTLAVMPPALGRNPRSQDRYAFLEALASAKTSVTISYLGIDPADHRPRLASTLVEELRVAWPDRIRNIRLPSQGFENGALGPAAESTFVRSQRTRAILAGPPPSEAVSVDQDLPPPALPLAIDQLALVLRNPLSAFARHRWGLDLREPEDPAVDDTLKLGPGGFDLGDLRRQVLGRALDAALTGKAANLEAIFDQAWTTLRDRRPFVAGRFSETLKNQEAGTIAQVTSTILDELTKDWAEGPLLEALDQLNPFKKRLDGDLGGRLGFDSQRLGYGSLANWWVERYLDRRWLRRIELVSGSTVDPVRSGQSALAEVLALADALVETSSVPTSLIIDFWSRSGDHRRLEGSLGEFQSLARQARSHITQVFTYPLPLYRGTIEWLAKEGLTAGGLDDSELGPLLRDYFNDFGDGEDQGDFAYHQAGSCPYFNLLFGGSTPVISQAPATLVTREAVEFAARLYRLEAAHEPDADA